MAHRGVHTIKKISEPPPILHRWITRNTAKRMGQDTTVTTSAHVKDHCRTRLRLINRGTNSKRVTGMRKSCVRSQTKPGQALTCNVALKECQWHMNPQHKMWLRRYPIQEETRVHDNTGRACLKRKTLQSLVKLKQSWSYFITFERLLTD